MLPLPNMTALPRRVRPVPFETLDSYTARLGDRNGLPARPWRLAVKNGGEEFLATAGGLRRDHFQQQRRLLPHHRDGSTCRLCTSALSDRFGCSRCTGGEAAAQLPHDGARVCRRHRRWVGPGTPIEQQHTANAATLAADRTYRRLRTLRCIDAHRLAELYALYVQYDNPKRPPEYYEHATDPFEQRNVWPSLTRERQDELAAKLGELRACGGATCRIVDQGP
jgi:hypothetical protein